MALLRRLVISALNQETSKRAVMRPDYMLSVLAVGLR
jgi:hypothetical protein